MWPKCGSRSISSASRKAPSRRFKPLPAARGDIFSGRHSYAPATSPPMTHKTWSPERYRREAGFVSELGAPVLDWLAPRAGERILDLGCGDGVLTEKITARGATVVGIDASPEMAAAAGRRGLDARLLAAEQMAFDGEFDAVFSNAALHWMRDTDAV